MFFVRWEPSPTAQLASISLITDLFQLAQVGKCWESPEYAPARKE